MDHGKEDKGPKSLRIGCTNFLKDVPRVPKSISGWGTTFNPFPRLPTRIYGL